MMNQLERDNLSIQIQALRQEEKYQEIVGLLAPLVTSLKAGDTLFLDLAEAYHLLENYTEAFKIFKELADNHQDHYAEAMIGGYFGAGMGVAPNPVESIAYFRKASVSNDPDTQHTVCKGMAVLYEHGFGVNRDIPLSFKYLKKALNIYNSEDLEESLENLKKKYPLTEDGEIDLKVRKRSKIASFFLWSGIIINVLSALFMYQSIGNSAASVASIICAFVYILTLCWNKFAIPLLIILFAYGIPAYGLFTQAILADNMNSVLLHGILLANSVGSFFVLLSLLKRKDGFAHPWYSLLRVRDNGCGPVKRFLNVILVYGQGEAFKNGSTQMKSYNIWRYIGLALVSVLAIIAAWNTAMMNIDMEIEWNCFNNSGMLTTLSVIGFFLQFTKGMWVKSSYETYDVYKDQYGNVKKVEKNRDMLTTIEGNFLYPLLCHLLLYPLIIGIILYYIIMGGFAVLQGVMPYLLGLLVLASIFLYYQATATIFLRKYRMILLGCITIITSLIYISIGDISLSNIFSMGATSNIDVVQQPTWHKFITAKTADVNFRKAPDSNSPKLMEEVGEMDSYLTWSDEPQNEYAGGRKPYRIGNGNACPVLSETNDWYEVLVQLPWANTVKAYIMKNLCKEVSARPIDNANFYKIPSGRFKGKYLYYDCGGIYAAPSSLTLGWEVNGGYLFPNAFKYSFENNGGPEIYNFNQLTEDTIEKWFEPLVELPIKEYTLYYNFGGEWPTAFNINPASYPSDLK